MSKSAPTATRDGRAETVADRLFHLVLLTREIVGADGARSEAYDGVFQKTDGADGKLILSRLDGLPSPQAARSAGRAFY